MTTQYTHLGALLLSLLAGCGTSGTRPNGALMSDGSKRIRVIETTNGVFVPAPGVWTSSFISRATLEGAIEAVLRHYIEHIRNHYPETRQRIFIKLPTDLDNGVPSQTFLARFKDVPRCLASYTEAALYKDTPGEGVSVREKAAPEDGYLCEVDHVLFINEREAVALGRNSTPTYTGKATVKFRLKRQGDRWIAAWMPELYLGKPGSARESVIEYLGRPKEKVRPGPQRWKPAP